MPNLKISADATVTPGWADFLPIVQSGANKKATVASLPISDATQTALDSKVDKVTWKGLSTEDYTTTEKDKLAGIEDGAEVNPTSTDELAEGSVNKYDQVVAILAGAGIQVTWTYPNFTVTNSSPDQVVALTAGTNITITGTYPDFTINARGGGGGGGGQVDSVVGGTNISVDSTDPTAPVVSLSLWADDNFVTDVEKTNIGSLDSAAYQPTSAFAPALGSDDNFVTDAEKVVIGNTSGTNTWDQTATTVANTPAWTISATTVQGAINELDSEKAPKASPTFTGLSTFDTVKITGGSPWLGKVATSDADWDVTWQTPSWGGSQCEPLVDYSWPAIIGVLGTYVFDSSKTGSKYSITVDSIPIGSNLIVELRKNSYTSGNVLSSTLQIATTDTLTNGKKTVSITDSDTYVAGDYVVAYLTSVGSTTPALNPYFTFTVS